MSDDQSKIEKHEPIDDGLLVYLSGDIEFSCSPGLRTELIGLLTNYKPQRMILDLSGVGYMDSSGIATIVETLQHQRQEGNKLILCSLQKRVYSMFEIASLDNLFTIVNDLDSAKQA